MFYTKIHENLMILIRKQCLYMIEKNYKFMPTITTGTMTTGGDIENCFKTGTTRCNTYITFAVIKFLFFKYGPESRVYINQPHPKDKDKQEKIDRASKASNWYIEIDQGILKYDHDTVFAFRNKNIWYFDSFGSPSESINSSKGIFPLEGNNYNSIHFQKDGWSCGYWSIMFTIFVLKFDDYDKAINQLKLYKDPALFRDYCVKIILLLELPDNLYMSISEFETIFRNLKYVENPTPITINHENIKYFHDIQNPIFLKYYMEALENLKLENMNSDKIYDWKELQKLNKIHNQEIKYFRLYCSYLKLE